MVKRDLHSCMSSSTQYLHTSASVSPGSDQPARAGIRIADKECPTRLTLASPGGTFFTSVHPSRALPVAVRAAEGLCRASTGAKRYKLACQTRKHGRSALLRNRPGSLPSESPTPSRRV
jgi:hypothetical protein